MVIFVQLITAVSVFVLGGVAYFRDREKPANQYFSIMCFFGSIWVLCGAATEAMLLNHYNPLLISRLSMGFAAFMSASILAFCLIYPNSSLSRKSLALIYFTAALITAPALTGDYIRDIQLHGNEAVRDFAPTVMLLLLYILYTVGLGIGVLIKKHLLATGREKNQTAYVLLGFFAGFLISIIFSFILPLLHYNHLFFIGYLGPLVFSACTAYAISKYRLMDISLVLKKTTAYSLVTTAITTTFVLVVIAFEFLFRAFYGYYSFWASVPAALVIAVTFMPVRERLQKVTDQVFFHQAYIYQKVIKEITRMIASVTDLHTLFRLIDRTIVRVMCIKNASVLLLEEKEGQYVVEKTNGVPGIIGLKLPLTDPLVNGLIKKRDAIVLDELNALLTVPGLSLPEKELLAAIKAEMDRFETAVSIPSFRKERLVGILNLGEKLSGEPYSPDDLEMLLTLASEAAIAIENAKLYRDVTETRDYLNSLVQESADAIVTLDLTGKVLTWNSGASRIFGLEPAAVIGQPLPLFTPDEVTKLILQVVKGGSVNALEIKNQDHPLLLTMSPIRDHNNQIIGISAIFKDISELKKVDQLKHEFLSVISHELRTPLTPIKGYLAMLLADQLGPLNERQKEAVGVISKQSNHLHQLIDSVIDLSRIEAGKELELEHEPSFLEELISESLEAASSDLTFKEIKVVFTAPAERTALMIDRSKLLRAIDNLLGNAIKFTPVKGTISITIIKNDREVRLAVQDTGIGLAKEHLPKIFEPFFQVDTSYTRSIGGVGMGLTVAKDIVEAHGGKIWAESAGLGQGTTISFSLPL